MHDLGSVLRWLNGILRLTRWFRGNGAILFLFFDHSSDRDHLVTVTETLEPHAAGRAALDADIGDGATNYDPRFRCGEEMLLRSDDFLREHADLRVFRAGRADSFRSPTGLPIFGDRRALAVAAGKDRQQLGFRVARQGHRYDLVSRSDAHARDTRRGSAHRTDFVNREAICVSAGRSEDDLLVAPGNPHVDQLVPLIPLDCADPALADVLKFREAGPFDASPLGHEDEESVWGEISGRNHRLNFLIRIEALHQVHRGLPPCLPPRGGQLEGLSLEHLLFRREEENEVMG